MIALLGLALPLLIPAQDPGSRLQGVLDYLVQQNQGNGGGVARVGIGRDQVLWQGTSGAVERNGAAIPADANFEIASTAKAFTAAALLLMVEDGLLDLDTPIGAFLPSAATRGLLVIQGHEYGPELTLRQMIQHTSGLPDYWKDPPYVVGSFNAFLLDYSLHPQRMWQPEEVLAYVPDLDPIFIPDSGWHYGDSGFVIAGLIMEHVDGRPLHEIYRHRIFLPLGMTETWLHWRETAPPGLVQSHRYEIGYDMYTKRQNSADWAAGGLVSTSRDMQIFLRQLATGGLFSDPQSLVEMTSWVDTGESGVAYGLGVFRVDLGFGMGEIWGHDGYGNSWMYYWPRHDITFTGTLNQTENDWWPLVFAAAWMVEFG